MGATFPFTESVGKGKGKAWDRPSPGINVKEGIYLQLSGTNSYACRPTGSERSGNQPALSGRAGVDYRILPPATAINFCSRFA